MSTSGRKIFNPHEANKPRVAPKHYRRTARSDYHCDAGCGDEIPRGGVYVHANLMRLHEECFERRYPT